MIKNKKKLSKEHRKNISLAMIGKKHTKEWKESAALRMIGNTINFGREHSKEHKRKQSEIMTKYTKENNPPHLFKKGHTPWSKGKKLPSPSPELIKKRLRKNPKSLLEIKFEDIINKLNLPYKFVGNGEVIVARKCPDFVDKNGKKIAIEVYYRRHKEMFRNGLEEWKADRIKIFNENGWKIIFFDETEVNDYSIISKLIGGNKNRK